VLPARAGKKSVLAAHTQYHMAGGDSKASAETKVRGMRPAQSGKE
jgi:hypothetical protein